MLIRTDDEMYRVDRTYLGPKGRRFFFRATYRAYGIWLVTAVMLSLLLLRLGVPVNAVSVLLAFSASVYVTIRIGRHLDHDRPLRAMVSQVWHEVNAPREPRLGTARSVVVGVAARRWSPASPVPRRWWDIKRRKTKTVQDAHVQDGSQ